MCIQTLKRYATHLQLQNCQRTTSPPLKQLLHPVAGDKSMSSNKCWGYVKIPTTPLMYNRSILSCSSLCFKDTQRKLHCAQSALTDSEQKREQRMKIIRKTHQSALALKQAVITELQDVIAEKDECISHLQAQLANSHCSTVPSKPVQVPLYFSTSSFLAFVKHFYLVVSRLRVCRSWLSNYWDFRRKISPYKPGMQR